MQWRRRNSAPSFFLMENNKMKLATLVVLALVAVTLASPSIENAQDTIVLDAAITKTCFDRHGYDFVSRWLCRSGFQRMGFWGLAFACAFNKGPYDLCENADKLTQKMKEEK